MGNSVAHGFLRSSIPIKRKSDLIDPDVEESDLNDFLHSPKRCKVMSTSRYIYKTLFEEGQGSDVAIVALNRTWNLHKLYLSQSPYFNSMFNGQWVETTQDTINIIIEDANITVEALHKVFGSLYQDEIPILPLEAISVLASATLLQLDELIIQSIEVMKDSISINTVLPYYEAADLYGLNEIKSSALDWLYKNTLFRIANSPTHLLQISYDLMTELISSTQLVVVQTEFSLYLLLKQWVFLKENPFFKTDQSLLIASDEYFKSHAASSTSPYLLTNSGSPYLSAFRCLRLKHLVIHHVDMEIIESDCIIPVEWFMPIFKVQWYHMLRVDQGVDIGPKQVSEDDFKRDCVRCGRVLETNGQYTWRWTGFNFGFDIVLTYSNGYFKLRRFQRTLDTDLYLQQGHSEVMPASHQKKRNLMYHISVYSLDASGKTLCKGETGIKTVALNGNEQVTILSFANGLQFPLLMSANFLLTTPLRSTDEVMPIGRSASNFFA